LEKVIHQHSHTVVGKHSLLLLGAIQRNSGQIELAKKSFGRAKQEFSKDNFLYYSALMGLGYLQEDEAKLDEARHLQECPLPWDTMKRPLRPITITSP